MIDILQTIIQPGVISVLLPLAIKGVTSLIADIRLARRKSAQQLLVGIPLSFRSELISRFPTVSNVRDVLSLNSNIIFLRYNNLSAALKRCDYVLVDQLQYTDPRIIDESMLQDLINAYSKTHLDDKTLGDGESDNNHQYG